MARRSLFRHILVPHDFSAQATVALTTAAQLAKEHGGKLSVLYVLVPFYLPADVPEFVADAGECEFRDVRRAAGSVRFAEEIPRPQRF